MNRISVWCVAAWMLVACGDSSSQGGSGGTGGSDPTGGSGGTGGAPGSGGSGGAGGESPPVDKAAQCASEFGDALTEDFGRADGIVLAVVKPTDTQCPTFNDDHVVLEILIDEEVYRMVINVLSDSPDPDVRFQIVEHALPGPAWSEGWHAPGQFDYVVNLDVHSDEGFTPIPMAELSDRIADEITIGDKISVYSTSSGNPSSTHLIHRNPTYHDGAIVLSPDTSPRFMLFHFENQTF